MVSRPGDTLLAAARRLDNRSRAVRTAGALLDGAILAAAVSSVLTVLLRLGVIPSALLFILPSAAGAVLLLSAVFGLASGKDTLGNLIRADGALKLKERLSTAYELLHSPAGHPMLGLLLRDGDAAAASVDATRIVPFPGKTRIPLLAALLFLLVAVSFVSPRGAADEAAELAQDVEDLGRRLIERAERELLPETRRIAEAIQELSERLQKGGGNRAEAARELSRLAEAAREARERLEAGGVSPPPVGRSPGNGSITRPADGENGRSGESPRERADSGAGGDRPAGGARPGQSVEAEPGDAESLEEAEEALLALAAGKTQDVAGEEEGSSKAVESAATGGSESRSDEEPGAGERGDSSGTGSSGSPGSSPAEDESDESGRIYLLSEEQPSALPGLVEPGESIGSIVRSLPESVDAGVQETEILADYRKQIEEAVGGSRLPPRLRETARSYFLLLGMTEAE